MYYETQVDKSFVKSNVVFSLFSHVWVTVAFKAIQAPHTQPLHTFCHFSALTLFI